MSSPTAAIADLQRRATAAEDRMHLLCQRHALTFLRVALGAIFVLFGTLKFFPGLSPAQTIAELTTQKLTLGLVPAQTLLTFVAFVEVTVGLLLISGRAMRFALWLLAFEMLAILSPIVLLPGELFGGPHHLPNLLGQYILKDFVLLGAVLVLFAHQRAQLVPSADAASEFAGGEAAPSTAPDPAPSRAATTTGGRRPQQRRTARGPLHTPRRPAAR